MPDSLQILFEYSRNSPMPFWYKASVGCAVLQSASKWWCLDQTEEGGEQDRVKIRG